MSKNSRSWEENIFYNTVTLVGLAGAGKTTLAQRIKDPQTTIKDEYNPTTGVSNETFYIFDTEWKVADLAGQESFRRFFWKEWVENADAIVFLIDPIDKDSYQNASDALDEVISYIKEHTVFLFLINKIDLISIENNPNPSPEETISNVISKISPKIIESLQLNDKSEKFDSFGIFPISAKELWGTGEAMKWLNEKIMNLEEFKDSNTSVGVLD